MFPGIGLAAICVGMRTIGEDAFLIAAEVNILLLFDRYCRLQVTVGDKSNVRLFRDKLLSDY
jgi:hypothetical protein